MSDVLLTLLSVVVGAGLAQVPTLIITFGNKKHEKKELLRKKYEEFAVSITSSQDWIFSVSTTILHQEMAQIPFDSPYVRKALALSYIFFPELQNACDKYYNACLRLRMKVQDENSEGKVETPSEVDSAINETIEALDNLQVEIRKHAGKYAKV